MAKRQYTFVEDYFEQMLDDAFERGSDFNREWNLDQNGYKGTDTAANRALMDAFIHGVIGRDKR